MLRRSDSRSRRMSHSGALLATFDVQSVQVSGYQKSHQQVACGSQEPFRIFGIGRLDRLPSGRRRGRCTRHPPSSVAARAGGGATPAFGLFEPQRRWGLALELMTPRCSEGREQIQHWWELGSATQVADTGGPTQRHGRNLDWYVGSVRLPIDAMGTVVVTMTMGLVRANILGRRLVGPTPIPEAAMAQVGREDWAQRIQVQCGTPPVAWEQLTQQAETL